MDNPSSCLTQFAFAPAMKVTKGIIANIEHQPKSETLAVMMIFALKKAKFVTQSLQFVNVILPVVTLKTNSCHHSHMENALVLSHPALSIRIVYTIRHALKDFACVIQALVICVSRAKNGFV